MQIGFILSSDSSGDMSSITVQLANAILFHEFAPELNEQVLTRNGRCQFPEPMFKIENLDNDILYELRLKFSVASSQCTYRENKWIVPENDLEQPDVFLYHSAGPQFGARLKKMKYGVAFDARLTNSGEVKGKTMVQLLSLHKYSTSLQIRPVRLDMNGCYYPIDNFSDFPFTELDFITTTKYKNSKITKFKADNNKFSCTTAKSKRKRSSTSSEPSAKRSPNSSMSSESSGGSSCSGSPMVAPSYPVAYNFNQNATWYSWQMFNCAPVAPSYGYYHGFNGYNGFN